MSPTKPKGDEVAQKRAPPRQFSLESFRRKPKTSPTAPLPAPVRPSNPRKRPRPQESAHTITKINNKASHSIRAAHTILDPAAIIKELVENSLDAKSTRIDVRVRGKGALDSITVSDNGHGISSDDFETLCLPSTTSKIFTFGDLENLATFGFRGEALSAVCAIAKCTTVTTRAKGNSIATALIYGNDASLKSRERTARPVGTTIHVENVFHALPVRQKDAVKNHTREIARCVAVVQALALISVNTRIELKIGGEVKVGNLPAMKDSDVIPSGLGNVCLSALRHNAKSVLGARTTKDLLEVATEKVAVVKIPASAVASMRAEGLGEEIRAGADAAYGCHGLVSKASLDANGGGGRARSSYQYIYVNRRPVDFPRLTRTIKDVYRRATGLNGAAPVVILNLVLPAWSCDVNLAPDKRVVCVHEEDTLISGIVSMFETLWIPTKTMSIPVQKDSDLTHLIQSSPKPPSNEFVSSQAAEDVRMVEIPDEPELEDSLDVPLMNENCERNTLPSSDDRMDLEQSGSEEIPTPLPTNENLPAPVSAERTPLIQESDASVEGTPATSEGEPSATPPGPQPTPLSPIRGEKRDLEPVKAKMFSGQQQCQRRSRESLILASAKNSTTRNVSSFIARRSRSLVPAKRPLSAKFSWHEKKGTNEKNVNESIPDESPPAENQKQTDVIEEQPAPVFDEPRIEGDGPKCVATLHVDWDQICDQISEGGGDAAGTQGKGSGTGTEAFKDATIRNIDNELVNDAHHKAAEREMSRLFHQAWFKDFEILGQFNRGFIITRLRSDLFIIDQHASDEKHNFEDLQRNTVISKQRLVQPLCLDFSAQDEVLVSQHLSAFRAGGFDIEYREQNPPTRRLYLKAQPISKHTIFVQDDLREIVDMLKSEVVQSSSMDIKVLRPPRVRAMFASRACRKSVMIGTALQKPQMTKIVRKLATLEHPWTCPHGRPTMRHLCSLPSGTA